MGNKREKKECLHGNKVGDLGQHLVVLETLDNYTNAISRTMALKEKKEHLLSMAKFYKGIKDKKSMIRYIGNLKHLEHEDNEEATVGASINDEGEMTTIKSKKTKIK
jgi:3-deoxy-D-manno-octulosonate 8-phosphate phosphatase KdsC-like HAD superfamily phosphatase